MAVSARPRYDARVAVRIAIAGSAGGPARAGELKSFTSSEGSHNRCAYRSPVPLRSPTRSRHRDH